MSTKIHYTHCPACESDNIHFVLFAKDHTTSGETFEIWECKTCSLRFTQDVPDQTSIRRYYESEEYISHTDNKKGLVNQAYHFVRQHTLKTKFRLIQRITGVTNGRILDIGAGIGAFVRHMGDHGWNAYGIEADVSAIRKASEINHIQLGEISTLYNLPAASYDAITLWHVIEHVHSLHDYISQIRILIKPTGFVFIAVPNYTSYDARNYGSCWAAYDVPRHLFHFSPQAMKKLISKSGFRLIKMEPMWFDSFYVSLLSEKNKSGRVNLLKGAWHGLMANIKTVGSKDKASSIIYVLQK